MANMKRGELGYQPYQGQSVLAGGMLAVDRPGGEVEHALSQAMFGAANVFGQQAESNAIFKGNGDAPSNFDTKVTVSGGDKATIAAPNAGAPAGVNSHMGNGTVRSIIANAAGKYGQSPSLMLKFANIESGMNPNAKNKNSSAGGLFQQTDGNAAQYGVADRFDAAQSADGAARFLRDNGNHLRKVLGRDPTEGELYLAHQQGGGGAAALLKNPNASAVSVVGLKAVIQNGGNANMSAGQFASLWTHKFGDAPVGEGIGPLIINQAPAATSTTTDPTIRTPLDIQSTGEGLQTTGRNTLYGSAYDAAATSAYAKQLNNEMLDASQTIFDKYKDSPQELQLALNQLKQVQMEKHVPDEIAADYENAFSGIQRSYMRQAQNAYEKKLQDQAGAEFDAKSNDYAQSLSRAEVGLSASNPDSLVMLQGEAQRLKSHWQEGVAKGLMTPQQAADASQKLDGDVAVAFHMKQTDGKSHDEIIAMRDAMKTDYAAGKLNGIDARAWDKLYSGLQGAANDAQSKQNFDGKKLGSIADSILTRAASGYDISASEIDGFRKSSVGVKDGDTVVTSTLAVLDIARSLHNGPIAQADAKVKSLKDAMGPTPDAMHIATYETAVSMIDKARTALATDPLGYAERMGVIPATGNATDMKTAGDFSGLVSARMDAADKAAQHFGISPRFFKPGEVDGLEKLMETDPAQGASIAAAIVQGAGNRSVEVLREFGKQAPLLSGAGSILADGGSAKAAQDAIAGGGKDENGKAYPIKGWQERSAHAVEVVGAALVLQPDDAQRVVNTADLITRKRMADAGVEDGTPQATQIHDKAINEAAGAIYDGDTQWGGFGAYDPSYWASPQKVVVPNNIRADRFSDVILSLRDSDFGPSAGQGQAPVAPQGGVERLQSLWPVLTKNGYMFVDFTPDGKQLPLAGTDGRPFVLPLGDMASRLGARNPGAFRGY